MWDVLQVRRSGFVGRGHPFSQPVEERPGAVELSRPRLQGRPVQGERVLGGSEMGLERFGR